MKELKYIFKDIIRTIMFDMKSSNKLFEKPKEMLKALLWFFVIMLATKNYTLAKLTILLYGATYMWLILRRGRWKKIMREDYKKRLKK